MGRYFGKWLSYMAMGIGFLIAAFDAEKRAMHDMICDTRVIKLNSAMAAAPTPQQV